MLSQLPHLISRKRQSRALLQAIVVPVIILSYIFYARGIYQYPGEEIVNGSDVAEGEQRKGGGNTNPMAGVLPEGVHATGMIGGHGRKNGQITNTVTVDGIVMATTMVTKTKSHPTGMISESYPAETRLPSGIFHPKPSLPTQPLNTTLLIKAPKYIKAILDPFDTSFDRLSCPGSVEIWDRYSHLRTPDTSSKASKSLLNSVLHGNFGFKPTNQALSPSKPRYFFALDLYKVADLLPRLMSSIIEAIKFLGPENCVLSIVEGRSDDGTYEVLFELGKEMEKLGIRYFLQASDLDPKAGDRDRIDALAELRNLALKDLIENPETYDGDTTVVFSNDVSLCVEDVLELVHQKDLQKADMVCGMDWNIWNPLTFYDSWVARGINGDLLIKILREEDSMVDDKLGIFWNHELSRKRYDAWKPVQVFACWNGITAFTAKPIMERKIKFRYVPRDDKNECYQSEPNLFAKDMWFHGHGRVAIIPTVNLAYSDADAKRLREEKGWAGQHMAADDEGILIEWVEKPPEKVICVPWLRGDQEWYSWNQGLPGSVKGEKGYKTEEELAIEASIKQKEKEKEAERKAEEEKKIEEEKQKEEKEGEQKEEKEGEQKEEKEGEQKVEEEQSEEDKRQGEGSGEVRE